MPGRSTPHRRTLRQSIPRRQITLHDCASLSASSLTFTEDDIQRARFGPRGVPGAADPARMTPQRAKKTPGHIDQGHVS